MCFAVENYIVVVVKLSTLHVSSGTKNACLSLILDKTVEVLAKSVVSWKHRDTYAEILKLICAAYVVWEVLGKKHTVLEFFLVKND